MDKNTANMAPYAAPENVLRVLEKVHKNGLRGKIDPDFLGQLGINEAMVNRVIRTMEFLGFTDPADEGARTPLLDQYIVSSEDDARALLGEAIRKSYEVIFRAADPTQDDRSKVLVAFKVMRPEGQWTRMVTLFLGLCKAAGMDVKDPPKDRPAASESKKARSERKAQKAKRKTDADTTPQPLALPPAHSRALDPALASIVGKVSELETLEDLDAWYAMFKAAFQYVKKVHN
jgi:hypothetical protein